MCSRVESTYACKYYDENLCAIPVQCGGTVAKYVRVQLPGKGQSRSNDGVRCAIAACKVRCAVTGQLRQHCFAISFSFTLSLLRWRGATGRVLDAEVTVHRATPSAAAFKKSSGTPMVCFGVEERRSARPAARPSIFFR